MAGLAAETKLERLLALVGKDRTHAARLADDCTRRLCAEFRQPVDHVPDTAATDFLVVGEGEVYGTAKRHGRKFRRHRKHAGEETLHIGCAASRQPPAVYRQSERIGAPGLVFDRHDIAVAGQDVAWPVTRSDRCEQVESVALRPGQHRDLDAPMIEMRAQAVGDPAVGCTG